MTAKEHCERVRFDPKLVKQKFPSNGFKCIYPKDAQGEDPDLYLKIQKKANDIFRSSTGTVPAKKATFVEEKKAKKKKKKTKKKRESENQKQEISSNDEDESNWQEGGP